MKNIFLWKLCLCLDSLVILLYVRFDMGVVPMNW